MKLAIVGSRSFTDYDKLKAELNKLPLIHEVTEIVSGGARGVDKLAESYAYEYKLKMTVFKPNWDIGKHAGFLRNTTIIQNSDAVVAFWDGKSTGTKDSIDKATKAGKPVLIIYTQGE